MMENNLSQVQAKSTVAEMVTSRQVQEVQGQILMAKKFPRDYIGSCNRVMQACQRKRLAEKATYEYPRGGQMITGPSIRLAEAIAQNWGNISFGIVELEQRSGESQVMAYAWDLETNTRQERIFSVPHVRSTKKGNIPLTDPRDIYEMVANQGARRLRACILGVVPGDVVEDALEQCNKTIEAGETKPLIERVKKAVNIFMEEFGVPVDAIEKYIGCKSDAFSNESLIRLNKVYNSLRDGMAKREDYFDLALPKDDYEITNPFADKENKKDEKKEKIKKTEKTKEETGEETDGQQSLPINE